MKRRHRAMIIAALLGWVGGHHFYLKNYLRGMIYFALWWSLFPAMMAGVEVIFWAFSSDQDFAQIFPSPTPSLKTPIPDPIPPSFSQSA